MKRLLRIIAALALLAGPALAGPALAYPGDLIRVLNTPAGPVGYLRLADASEPDTPQKIASFLAAMARANVPRVVVEVHAPPPRKCRALPGCVHADIYDLGSTPGPRGRRPTHWS